VNVRPIRRLLVANRGEIARRVFSTARDMGIEVVAVFAAADAAAPFVTDADEAMRLPGGYLDGAAIIAAAQLAGADAIHPGYGFLSENADFAAAVDAAGLTWVGPPPDVIRAMGDKIAAKRLAREAGVPILPSVEDVSIGDDLAPLGYPLLVKAAAGGGGKGMRIVGSPDDLAEAIAAARREAASAFGDDRVFVERYIANARHIEVQILGDAYGTIVHLGERECSIQRRHQKVVEEAPSPMTDANMRAAMGDAAIALAGSLGYRSAGTVEFVVDGDSREFFFLEVNTRLQVEHPVTEAVTGIDLVREQLRIAAGEALGYGQADVAWRGHAVEVRLYAEDAANGFLPATGTLDAFEPAPTPAVRWDSGVVSGSTIGVDFDPMLAKVIAHAPTRSEAAGRLARALERLHIAGVTTNRDLLGSILRDPAFLAGELSTDFIDRRAPAATLAIDDDELHRVAAAAALWLQGHHRAEAAALASAPSGWRNARLPDQRVRLSLGVRCVDVSYRSTRDGTFALADGTRARAHRWSPTAIDVEIDGRRSSHRITRTGAGVHVQTRRGGIDLEVAPRFPTKAAAAVAAGSLVAPMPGIVTSIRVAPGDTVAAGQLLVLLEAMKMEHRIAAPTAGRIAEIRVAVGAQVRRGDPLLVLTPRKETSDE
jgi:propionyl-CoA carboxylase alpha chain